MTMTQLERYMVLEVKNLHIKIDDAFTKVVSQLEYVTRAVDRIERQLDEHEMRFDRIDKRLNEQGLQISALKI